MLTLALSHSSGHSARNVKNVHFDMLKTYASMVYGALCIFAGPSVAPAQITTSADADRATCAALLRNDSSVGTRIGPTDSARRQRDTTTRPRPDTAAFGIGGARTGPADVMLLVGVHADEVRFGSQPHLRVRLCWGGDTLRVVQRDNLPSPVVAGTTYRNVYVAVELIGRINAECLADRIGVRSAPQVQQPNPPAEAARPTSASNCAFLGGSAATGQNPRPPNP
jgi:hypothetical protein